MISFARASTLSGMPPPLRTPSLRLVDADASPVVGAPPATVQADFRIAARSSGKHLVFLSSSEVWAFEARERLVFVHASQGTFDIDLPLGEVESLGPWLLRVHRNWLVSVARVRELHCGQGAMHLFAGAALSDGNADRRGVEVPVARDRMKQVRRRLLADTFGVSSVERGAPRRLSPTCATGASRLGP
jgi:hypothetical protein